MAIRKTWYDMLNSAYDKKPFALWQRVMAGNDFILGGVCIALLQMRRVRVMGGCRRALGCIATALIFAPTSI